MTLPFDIEPGALSQAAVLAAHGPPRSFAAFSLTPVTPPPGPRILPIVYFEVRCRSCGQDQFHVGSFPATELGADSWPLPPHSLKCAACGAAGPVFDPRKDGYDGILCGGCPCEVGESGEAFTPGAFKMHVAATYNIPLDELRELAEEAGGGVKPADLFDWINIIGEAVGEGENFEYDYECG
jgi:hypothetical protein